MTDRSRPAGPVQDNSDSRRGQRSRFMQGQSIGLFGFATPHWIGACPLFSGHQAV